MTESEEYDFIGSYEGQDIVVVGESHVNRLHKDAESTIIEALEPEYVLTEVYGDRDPDRVDSDIEPYAKVRTINDMKDLLEEDEGDLVEDALAKIETEHSNLTRELKEKPFYEWDKKQRDRFTSAYDSIKENLDTSHSVGARLNLPLALNSGKRSISGARKNIIHLIDGVAELRNNGHKSKIGGNDLSRSERPDRNTSTSELVDQYAKTKDARDARMAERAIYFTDQSETSRPVMNVVGSDHYQEVMQKIEEDNYDVFGINLVDELN